MSTPQTHAELSPVEPAPEPAHEEPHLVRTPIYKLPVCQCMLPCCTRIEHGTLVCICTDCALDHGPPDDPPV